MPLWRYAHCGYASYGGLQWRQVDFDAYKLVQTLKGREINGWATVQDRTGKWHKITTEAPNGAFEIFGRFGAGVIEANKLAPCTLTTVPSSTCLELNSDPKGKKLAESILTYASGCSYVSMLRWGEQSTKATAGGPRDPDVLFSNLWIRTDIKPTRFVLVDDVTTTHGHALACARALRSRGHTVEHLICAAQTVWDYPANMFSIATIDIEAPPPVSQNFPGILGIN